MYSIVIMQIDANYADVKPYVKLHKYIGSDEQQLALALLHKEKKLVPEHVETRTLENPNQPGISQVRIEDKEQREKDNNLYCVIVLMSL